MSDLVPAGSLPLKVEKQEKYCRLRASGMSQRKSAVTAGYKGGESNASHLERKPHVAERLKYLKNQMAIVVQEPNVAYDAARAGDMRSKEMNLAYYTAELRVQLALARQDGDTALGFRILTLLGAALNFVNIRDQRIPKTGKAAKRHVDGDDDSRDAKQRQARAPAAATQEEVSEVLGLVDSLGGGLGDESEAEDPPEYGVEPDIPEGDGGEPGGEDGDE